MTDLIDRLLAGPQPDRHSGVIMEEAADEIERLRQCLQYEQHRAERIGTHGPGCWAWGPQHYECAVREIEHALSFMGNKKPAGVRLHAEAWRVLLDEVYKDAARYRYLRHESRRKCLDLNGPAAGCWIDCEDEHETLVLLTGEDADKAIDAAMEHDDVQR